MKRKPPNRFMYYFSIAFILLSGAAAVFIGSSAVRVSCHNTVSSSPMVFFNVEDSDRGTVITFMDRQFTLPESR